MNYTYLFADEESDKLFGFHLTLALRLEPLRMSLQEHYILQRARRYFNSEPVVGDIVVVGPTPRSKIVRRVDVQGRRRADPTDLSLSMEMDVVVAGDYPEPLRGYLAEETPYDKIVIAQRKIAHDVHKDLERMISQLSLRAVINSIATGRNES